MRKSHSKLWAVLCSLSILVTGCGETENKPKNLNADLGPSLAEGYSASSKVEIDESLLDEQGLPPIIEESASGALGKSSRRTRLRRGSKLVGVIDTACMEHAQSGMSREIQESTQEPRKLQIQAYAFELNADEDLEQLSRDAEADPCVLQVSNNSEVTAIAAPNDPNFSRQWHMTAIEAPAAYDVFYGATGGVSNDAVIAVIDTGVNYNHPDLSANMWKSASGAFGQDFTTRDGNPMDDNGHGTHVAGIAAAVRNNNTGIAGVMGTRVKIMAVKVLAASGSGSTANVVNGINYAVENGAHVINLSLGHKGTDAALRTAMTNAVNKGVTVIVAAGNNGQRLTSGNWYSPASYGREIKGMMAVASMTSSGALSSFSNYGSDHVEIGAPGSNIYSTLNSGYSTMSGTSMASPVVAGAAALTVALLKSRGVQPTPALVEKLLLDGSVKVSDLNAQTLNGNKVNLRTLAVAINGYVSPGTNPTPPPTPTPTPTPTPEPTPTPPMTADCGPITGQACEVFKAINAQRRENGLPDLSYLSNCQNLAQSHAQDMAANGFFSHTSPTQGSFSQRVAKFGLSGGSSGENIAYGYSTAGVVSAWMNSSGHRANILNRGFRSAGLGLSKDSAGRPYYVQCFSSK